MVLETNEVTGDGMKQEQGLFTEDNPYSGFYKTSLETGIFVVKCQNVEAFKLAVEQIEINLKELGKKQETDLKLKQKDLQISNLQEEVASLKDALDEKQEELNEWSNYFEETDLKLKQKDLQISNLQEKVAAQRSDVFISYEKDNLISKLQAKVTSLENAQKVIKEENWIKARNGLQQKSLQIPNYREKVTFEEREEEYPTKARKYRLLNDIVEDRKAIDLEEAIMLTLWDEIEDQEIDTFLNWEDLFISNLQAKVTSLKNDRKLTKEEGEWTELLNSSRFTRHYDHYDFEKPPLLEVIKAKDLERSRAQAVAGAPVRKSSIMRTLCNSMHPNRKSQETLRHCKSCWKKFKQKRDMHVRKDTGGKLFKCKPFKKAFWRR